jgi:hypothetical protein
MDDALPLVLADGKLSKGGTPPLAASKGRSRRKRSASH